MKQHDFTLVLTTDPDDEQADRMYGVFDDGTSAWHSAGGRSRRRRNLGRAPALEPDDLPAAEGKMVAAVLDGDTMKTSLDPAADEVRGGR